MTAPTTTTDRRARIARALRADALPRRQQAVAFAALLLAAASRGPYLLAHGRFYAEEGSIYFSHMRTGSIWFVARPVGYIYAFCNLGSWLATRVPLEQAPLVTTWLAFGLVAILVGAALSLPSELLPNAGARLAAATLLVVGPVAVPAVWLNTTNAQVYLGVLALLFLFVDVGALGRTRFTAVATLLALAGLSGLYAAALAPLFVFRAVRERVPRRAVLAAIISFCAIAQLVVVERSHASGDLAQGRGTFRGFGAVTRDVAAWHFGTFIFGSSIATHLYRYAHTLTRIALFGLVAGVVAVVLAVVLAFVRRRRVAALLVAAFALEEVLVLFGTRRGAGGRYAVVPIAILVLIVVHALTAARNRIAVGIAAALCAAALVAGLSTFWTAQPSTLRCDHCPDWTRQVHAWQAGGPNRLAIWPYKENVRWEVRLRRRPEPVAHRDRADGANSSRSGVRDALPG